MPRTAKRAPQQPTSGQNYGNRSDLAIKTAPGQEYGQAGQQAAAQEAVPLPNAQEQLAKMVSQAGQQPQGPVAGSTPAQSPQIFAGELGALNRPTELPSQPVTQGSPSGPGAGPGALGPVPATKVSQTIAQVAAASGNPDLMALAQHALAQGQ